MNFFILGYLSFSEQEQKLQFIFLSSYAKKPLNLALINIFSCVLSNNLIFLNQAMTYILPFEVVYFQVLIPGFVNAQMDEQCLSNDQQSHAQLSHQENIEIDEFQRIWQVIQREIERNSQKNEKKVWCRQEDKILVQLREQGTSWIQICKLINGTNPQVCKRRFNRLAHEEKKWPKQIDYRVLELKEKECKGWKQISLILKKQFQINQKEKLRQIRYRYELYLNSKISKNNWSVEEDLKLLNLVREFGRKWKHISRVLKNRTELQVKNRFYGTLLPITKRMLKKLGYNNTISIL